MKKVLILSYFSPPGNFAGSYRIKSWLDYFSSFGYFPVLVTRFWNKNETKLTGISRENEKKVEKTERFEIHYMPFKGDLKSRFFGGHSKYFSFIKKTVSLFEILFQNFFIRISSSKNLYFEAKKTIEENPDIKLLIVSGRPFLLFKYAYLLKKEFPHIHWIADYRDPWTTNQVVKTSQRQRFFAIIERSFEKKWAGTASLFTTCSQEWVSQISELIKVKGLEVKNGFDDQFYLRSKKPKKKPTPFLIVYNGTLYPNQPVEIFLEGFVRFVSAELAPEIKLVFAGTDLYFKNTERLKPFMEKTACQIEMVPRLEQEAFFELLSKAQVCFLTNYIGENGRHSAKLFDYLASGNPIILCPSDNDVMAKTIEETKTGFIVNTAEEVTFLLSKLYNEWLSTGSISFSPNHTEIQKYSRKAQAEIMCKALDKLSLGD